jgi:hypothetical protein
VQFAILYIHKRHSSLLIDLTKCIVGAPNEVSSSDSLPSRGMGALPQAPASKPKPLDQVRIALRWRHYRRRTEPTYVHLKEHLDGVKKIHAGDLATGFGRVQLAFALGRKYPSASSKWQWQFVLPPPESKDR